MSNTIIGSETVNYAIQNIDTSADIDDLTKRVSKIIMQKHIAQKPVKKYMRVDLGGEITERPPTDDLECVAYTVYCCPSCGKCYGFFKTPFCSECGQKIEWEQSHNEFRNKVQQ